MPLVADHPPLSMQEAFDLTVARLLDGKGRSVGADGTCLYRTSDGSNSCAVGCHIPDSLNPGDLDKSGHSTCVSSPYINDWLQKHNIYAFDISLGSEGLSFLCSIQNHHDTQINWTWNEASQTWSLSDLGRVHLREIASRYSLSLSL